MRPCIGECHVAALGEGEERGACIAGLGPLR